MIHSAEIIILATTKVGDSSLVIHCLSEEWGRRSFITSASRSRMPLLMPLSIVEAEISENRNSDLWRAGKMCAAYPLNGIRNDVKRSSITLFMSEMLYRIIKDGAREPGLYEWCRSSILTLDAMDGNFANFHIRWTLEFAVALGFRPDSESLAPFAGEHADKLNKFLTGDWAESMLIPMNGSERSELVRSLIAYLAYHCDSRVDIRSLDVLHELFV